MTLNSFWSDCYLPYSATLRKSTLVGYESAFRKHISPRFGNIEISDITIMEIEMWLLSFKTAGAAKKAYSVLRVIMNLAYKWGYSQINLAGLKMNMPKGKKYQPEILTLDEIKQLIKAFKGHQLEAMIICEANLGLRRGEACGLKWKDINFKKNKIKIRRSRQYVNKEVIVVPPKTEKSKRTLLLSKVIAKRLKKLSKGHSKDEWLCPLSPDMIARIYKQHCQKSGIKYVPLTNLRHSCATAMLSIGIEASVVAKILGHTDVSTTYRYYLHPQQEAIEQAQKKFDSILNN